MTCAQCCGSGSGAFLAPRSGIRDPGWVKYQDLDPGSDSGSYFRELRNNLIVLKYLNYLMRIRYSGIFWTLDPGWKKFGSVINIPDPQHCLCVSVFSLPLLCSLHAAQVIPFTRFLGIRGSCKLLIASSLLALKDASLGMKILEHTKWSPSFLISKFIFDIPRRTQYFPYKGTVSRMDLTSISTKSGYSVALASFPCLWSTMCKILHPMGSEDP
jgi:hypothetical protein